MASLAESLAQPTGKIPTAALFCYSKHRPHAPPTLSILVAAKDKFMSLTKTQCYLVCKEYALKVLRTCLDTAIS